MVVDTSALLAIVFGEDDAATYVDALQQAPDAQMSAVTSVEARIVVEGRHGPDAGRDLSLLVHEATLRIVPVDEEQADAAFAAWRRFGKGRHPAGLNLGDCFAYGLATLEGEPLLFKGDDFAATDVRSALR